MIGVSPARRSHVSVRAAGINTSIESGTALYQGVMFNGARKRGRCDPSRCPAFEWLVLDETSALRKVWSVVFMGPLMYAATILPFRLAFIDFYINGESQQRSVIVAFDVLVEILFVFDLFVNFFTSYRDTMASEVKHLPSIAVHYVCHGFALDLIACVPGGVYEYIFSSADSGTAKSHQVLRLARLNRFAKVACLCQRSARILNVMRYMLNHEVLRVMVMSKRLRTLKLIAVMIITVHLFGCMWYFVASMHSNPNDSWVARRGILDEPPFTQWVTSVYFVMTVFTTVGFGDMSASTEAEMLFLCFMMIAGSMYFGLLVGDCMTVFSMHNEIETHRDIQAATINTLVRRAEMTQSKLASDLRLWVHTSRPSRANDDVDAVKRMVSSNVIPRSLLERLPHEMYGGRVMANNLVTLVSGVTGRPQTRLPIFVALAGNKKTFAAGQIVYTQYGHAYNMYLVLSGTFADVLADYSNHPTIDDTSLRYPCRLWGAGNYFGEVEIEARSLRRCSVRCEVPGDVLAVSKESFLQMTTEFHEFSEVWRCIAHQRMAKLMNHRNMEWTMTNYRDFAATTIQRQFRIRRLQDTRNASTIALDEWTSSVVRTDIRVDGSDTRVEENLSRLEFRLSTGGKTKMLDL